MNSIHHVFMFDVDVCDIVLKLQYISYFKIFDIKLFFIILSYLVILS